MVYIIHDQRILDNLTTDDSEVEQEALEKDRRIDALCRAIAYADLMLPDRGRFILMRQLLTMLNKHQALPHEEVAAALGMSYISYRVTGHRLREQLKQFVEQELRGEPRWLDEEHEALAERLNQDFDKLYPQLMTLYQEVLSRLPQRDAIEALRSRYQADDGPMLHDRAGAYHVSPEAMWRRLWRRIMY